MKTGYSNILTMDMGVEIGEEDNQKNATIISMINSKVNVYVMPTDEEIVIAKETRGLYVMAQNKAQ